MIMGTAVFFLILYTFYLMGEYRAVYNVLDELRRDVDKLETKLNNLIP